MLCETGSFDGMELAKLARLAGQGTLRNTLALPFQCWIVGAYSTPGFKKPTKPKHKWGASGDTSQDLQAAFYRLGYSQPLTPLFFINCEVSGILS